MHQDNERIDNLMTQHLDQESQGILIDASMINMSRTNTNPMSESTSKLSYRQYQMIMLSMSIDFSNSAR